jgi:hypothetical protein
MSTAYGFKLFEEKEGMLYPLFIDKSTPIPFNEWIEAGCYPTNGYAVRPGWHVGTFPDAPWLKALNGTRKGCYRSRFKHGHRVWCLVEYETTYSYQELADQNPKHYLPDTLPVHGYYKFRENNGGVWVITGAIRVIRIIPESERQQLMQELMPGYDEAAAFDASRKAKEHNAKDVSKIYTED